MILAVAEALNPNKPNQTFIFNIPEGSVRKVNNMPD